MTPKYEEGSVPQEILDAVRKLIERAVGSRKLTDACLMRFLENSDYDVDKVRVEDENVWYEERGRRVDVSSMHGPFHTRNGPTALPLSFFRFNFKICMPEHVNAVR
jgi:hypothetical protein